jgi:hypothetical protein
VTLAELFASDDYQAWLDARPGRRELEVAIARHAAEYESPVRALSALEQAAELDRAAARGAWPPPCDPGDEHELARSRELTFDGTGGNLVAPLLAGVHPEREPAYERHAAYERRAQEVGYLNAALEAQRAARTRRFPSHKTSRCRPLAVRRKTQGERPRVRRARRRLEGPAPPDSGDSAREGVPLPKWVVELADSLGVAPLKLRWCRRCRTVAFAIDGHQQNALDEAGWVGDLCPRHARWR